MYTMHFPTPRATAHSRLQQKTTLDTNHNNVSFALKGDLKMIRLRNILQRLYPHKIFDLSDANYFIMYGVF